MRLLLRLDSPAEHANRFYSETCEFTEHGGSIGRGADCTWVLECPERLVSRRHAEIVHDGGCFWLVDNSANGVFHNDDDDPIGRGQRVAIAHDDTFRLGSFLVRADVDSPGKLVEIRSAVTEPVADITPPVTMSTRPGAVSVLRLADTTDSFVPPVARIPDDWEPDLRATENVREVPALVVNRRLNALQRAASQALLGNLLPHEAGLPDGDLGPEGAAAVGRGLRVCLELMWSLRGEFDRVDRRLTGNKSDEPGESAADIERFVQGLVQEESCAARLADLQYLAAQLRGRHTALHDSFTESLTTIVEQFQPEKFEERLTAAHREGGFKHFISRLCDRLFSASRLWRFYRDWHEQQRGSDYRAVHQLFEKKLISVYRRLNKARHQESSEALAGSRMEKMAVSAAK